jgi:alkylation response protein AidB-like acyl-CoA dehydrogenase
MAIGLAEEHEELAEATAGWAERHATPVAVRAAVDAATESRPPYWASLAEQGLLDVHVPEEYGGQGGGLLELAVVVEVLARAMVPGPQLPTVLASAAVLAAGESAKARGELLPGLADGSRTGAVVLPPEAFEAHGTKAAPETSGLPGPTGALGLAGERVADGLTIEGAAEPVLGAALADVIVLPVDTGEDGAVWVAVDATELNITPLASLDATRRSARVAADGVRVPAERILTGLDTDSVVDLAAVLLGADAAGVAGWCVRTAAEYAKVREQFGRPIGQFQGIKHKCARMLIEFEQATAAVWDAARALGEPHPDADGEARTGAAWAAPTDTDGGVGKAGKASKAARDERRFAAAVAAIIAPDAAVRCARDCVQVLGGIGFTWEHDAHLYLRRASTLRRLLGPSRGWASAVGRLALSGVRRPAEVELDDDTLPLRRRIREQLAELAAISDTAERNAAMGDQGWTAPHLPQPWGRDASPLEQVLIHQEMRAAGIRPPYLAIGAWVVPSIAVYGSAEQQERFLRPTLRGEIVWCQLFSEPGAGSDLASLQMKADRVEAAPRGGDRGPGPDDTGGRSGWRLTGQKIWTSLARQAEWGICLARTSNEPKKHDGITYFLVNMRAPGVEVRPLREMTGDSLFNEVFLDGVFVPDDCVVGAVGKGWQVARNTLTNERVSIGGSGIGAGTKELVGFFTSPARRASPDPVTQPPASGSGEDLRHEYAWLGEVTLVDIGRLVGKGQSIDLLGLRTTLRRLSGTDPGAASSVRKLLGVEFNQEVADFIWASQGAAGALEDTSGETGLWARYMLFSRSMTIYGGTTEVQLNIIAERMLGLPRDPEPDQ